LRRLLHPTRLRPVRRDGPAVRRWRAVCGRKRLGPRPRAGPVSAVAARVSIIIPCRDSVRWLGAAIRSCLAQSWKNLQVIVVDNGSSDGSLALAKRYESRGVAVMACERAGASAARNVGLAQADGDLVQFLDADDILDPDKIRLQVERLAAAPPAAVASGA